MYVVAPLKFFLVAILIWYPDTFLSFFHVTVNFFFPAFTFAVCFLTVTFLTGFTAGFVAVVGFVDSDADYAVESSRLISANILENATSQMMMQSNAYPQVVANLLS